MCIIAYKPAGVELLTKTTLQECFRRNNDGAGFAWWDFTERTWNVKKGFMKWTDFWKAFQDMGFTKKDSYACHFRIGTSGNKDGGNTHPFPLDTDYDKMRQTEFSSDNVIFHNGVVGIGDGIASDTMECIKDYLSPLSRYMFKDDALFEIFRDYLQTTKCRWLLLTKDTIFKFGTWQEDFGGAFFSNGGYKPYVANTTTSTTTAGTGHRQWPDSRGGRWSSHTAQQIQNDKETAKKGRASYVNGGGDIVNNGVVSFKNLSKVRALIVSATGEVRFKDAEDAKIRTIACPTCYETRDIYDAHALGYNMGDSICLTCGSVFDDHTGYVHFFEPNIDEVSA